LRQKFNLKIINNLIKLDARTGVKVKYSYMSFRILPKMSVYDIILRGSRLYIGNNNTDNTMDCRIMKVLNDATYTRSNRIIFGENSSPH